jgi:hypothetical protein
MTEEQRVKQRARVKAWAAANPGYQKSWRDANRERVNSWQTRWNAEHPDKRKEYCKSSYAAHRDVRLAASKLRYSKLTDEQKERRGQSARDRRAVKPRTTSPEQRDKENSRRRTARASNPEKDRARERKTRSANPDKQRAKWQLRRARKKTDVADKITPEQMDALYRTTVCYLCGEDINPGDSTSLDHIVPLARGGPHIFDNLALTHFSCNSRKGAKPFVHSC